MPVTLIDYKGLEILTPDPTGAGGLAIQTNEKKLADRTGPVVVLASAPDANDDSADTGGNGKLYVWSKWFDTAALTIYVCVDDTPTAAVWLEVTAGGGGQKEYIENVAMVTGTNMGDHRVQSLGGTSGGRYNFFVPADFTALVSLELIAYPSSGAAGSGKNIDLFSDYNGDGENFAAHSESDTTTVYDFTGKTDIRVSIDISGVFSSLAPLDECGLLVDHNSIGGAIRYKRIRMVYT